MKDGMIKIYKKLPFFKFNIIPKCMTESIRLVYRGQIRKLFFYRLLLDRKSFCNFSYHHLVAFKQNASLRHFYIGFIFLTWKLRPCFFLLFIELETRWLSNHSCCTTLSTYSGTHGVKCIVLLSLCNAKAEPCGHKKR